jgi:hypothetical protein
LQSVAQTPPPSAVLRGFASLRAARRCVSLLTLRGLGPESFLAKRIANRRRGERLLISQSHLMAIITLNI